MSDDEDDDASIGISKYPVMPSLVALQQMKNRLHLARMGKKLMKWRALATGRALRKLALELNKTYAHYKEDVAAAFIALARARFHNENLNNIVLNNVADRASVTIQLGNKNTAGVKLIQHSIVEDNTSPYLFLGIEKGGQVIDEAKKAWLDLLRCMVDLVQERSGFTGLDEAHRNANKREKVLLKLVIPRIKLTIRYIILELEELAREELHRIKMIKHQKKSKYKQESQLPQPLTTGIANEDLNEPMKESLNDIIYEPCDRFKVCCKKVNSDPCSDNPSMVEGGFLKKLSDIISLCKNLKSTTCLTTCDNIQQQTLTKYNVLCKEFPEDITEDMKCRLEDLKMHLAKVIGIAEEFKKVVSVSPSVESFVHSCAAVDKKLNLHHVPIGITEEKNKQDIHMERLKNKTNDVNARTEESIENKNNILKRFNNIVCGKEVSLKSESIDNLLEICENMKNVLTKVISNDEKNKAPYGVNAISRPGISECRNCLEVKDMERNIDGRCPREERETLQNFISESCSSNNNDEFISELCECCSNNATPPSVVNLRHHKSCPNMTNHRDTMNHPLIPRDILRHNCPTVIKVPMENKTSKISSVRYLNDVSSDQFTKDSRCCSKTISCNSSIPSIPLELSNCDHSTKIQDTQSSSKLSNRINAINSNRTQFNKSPTDCKLGYTETHRKKIVVTKRLKSSDGTVTEETVTTTIIKEKYDPTQTHMSDIEDDASPDSTL